MFSKSYLSRVVCDPIDELGDFRKDSGHSSARRRTEGNDADDVKASVAVATHQRTARITHACRPFARSAKRHRLVRHHLAPRDGSCSGSPDLACNLLKLICSFWWASFDESPAREEAVFVAAVILTRWGKAGRAHIHVVQVGILGEFQKSDIIGKSLRSIEQLVYDDVLYVEVAFGLIIAVQMPFTGANLEVIGFFRSSEAVGGAKHPTFVEQSSAANVTLAVAISVKTKRHLPREFSMTGIYSANDSSAASLLTALLGKGGSHQTQKN